MPRTGIGPATLAELRHCLLESERIGPEATLTALAGGVSSLVALVDDGDEQWVVKSPLHRLAVDQEWLVDRARGANEAEALTDLQGHLGPAAVPRLRFFDADQTIIGLEYIAGPPSTYKEQLLEGWADPGTIEALGSATAWLHRHAFPASLAGAGPRSLFDDLRLDPYYRFMARQRQELGPALADLIDETLTATVRGPVHGDLTPKNVLVRATGTVIVDWEVAHVGDMAFDLATMTAHLFAKALRTAPVGGAEPLIESVRQFWSAYDGPADRARALRHTGAVLLARLYGKSPVEYLDDPAARTRAHRVGVAALLGTARDLDSLLDLALGLASGKDAP
jgi:5-methylthioribose kinase